MSLRLMPRSQARNTRLYKTIVQLPTIDAANAIGRNSRSGYTRKALRQGSRMLRFCPNVARAVVQIHHQWPERVEGWKPVSKVLTPDILAE